MPPFLVGTHLLLKGHRDDLSPETEPGPRGALMDSAPGVADRQSLVAEQSARAPQSVQPSPMLAPPATGRHPPSWDLNIGERIKVTANRALLNQARRSGQINDIDSLAETMFGQAASRSERRRVMDYLIAKTPESRLKELGGVTDEGHGRASMTVANKALLDQTLAKLPNDDLGRRVRRAYSEAFRNGSLRVRK